MALHPTTAPLLLEVRIARKNDKNWLKPAVSVCLVLLMADMCKIGRLFMRFKLGTVDDAWYYKDHRSCAFSPSFHHQSGTSDGGAGGKCTPGIKSRLEETHCDDTVDGENPSPVDKKVYPFTYKVLYIPGGAGFLPWTVARKEWSLFTYHWMFLGGFWFWAFLSPSHWSFDSALPFIFEFFVSTCVECQFRVEVSTICSQFLFGRLAKSDYL